MKHILSRFLPALALAGITVGTTSCTDLTETPYDEVTEANFNPTAADLAALMAPVYTPLRAFMGWYGLIDGQGESADILLTPVRPNGWYDGGVYIRMHEHRWTDRQGQPNTVWNMSYAGINAANRVMYQIESGLIPTSEAVAASTIAELRAMRAYYYSLLLDNFGRVPIVTDFTNTELPEQATRQQVFDFVVSELEATAPLLTEESGTLIHGRMNYWANRGILARVYLNAEVYTGTPKWNEVLTLTQEIIASGKYQLASTYREPFSRTNHTSKELIFAVPYDAINAPGSNFHMKTLKPDLRYVFNMQVQPWGGSASNPQFIDTYDVDDDRLEDTWLIGPQFDAQGRGYNFIQHVPRIDSTKFENGYPVRKYEIYAGMTGSSDVDYPILRYAEVLMMRAEALMRLGQPGAGALVTQVRQRNFKGAAASKAVVTDAELTMGSRYNYGWYDEDGVVKTANGGAPVVGGGADIQYGRFLDELGWEFAVEAHRRVQLIRFGVFTTKMWFNHTPNGAHRTVFAIPVGALNTNNKLTQNPGY